ncbi:hypothetical protein C8J55DRAFT_487148 [Lentinula edodes]|uniref:Uncharacterized protein n=1 Tax=Lentinula lateritia TaxID=40482 RepID=A0A9W9ARJ4_9AGAR|nr:hypothetical protein C8J55DRAFT_487148 [Lentinula edodes]
MSSSSIASTIQDFHRSPSPLTPCPPPCTAHMEFPILTNLTTSLRSDVRNAARWQSTLPVPALRSKYNEFDTRESAPESVFVDPEEVSGKIFAGERRLRRRQRGRREGREWGRGREGHTEWKAGGSRGGQSKEGGEEPEVQRAAARTERVTQLSANLERKLGIFTESATGIDDVGVNVYSASRAYQPSVPPLTSNPSLTKSKPPKEPDTSHLPSIRNSKNSLRGKGYQALSKGAKLAIQSALREKKIRMALREKAALRAVALQILGDTYIKQAFGVGVGGGGGNPRGQGSQCAQGAQGGQGGQASDDGTGCVRVAGAGRPRAMW